MLLFLTIIPTCWSRGRWLFSRIDYELRSQLMKIVQCTFPIPGFLNIMKMLMNIGHNVDIWAAFQESIIITNSPTTTNYYACIKVNTQLNRMSVNLYLWWFRETMLWFTILFHVKYCKRYTFDNVLEAFLYVIQSIPTTSVWKSNPTTFKCHLSYYQKNMFQKWWFHFAFRRDLKLILMSATLRAELFSDYFGQAPTVNIPGFTFGVTEFYLEDILELTRYVSTYCQLQQLLSLCFWLFFDVLLCDISIFSPFIFAIVPCTLLYHLFFSSFLF